MRLQRADYEIIEQSEGIYGIYKAAEYAGRICLHSEDKQTNASAIPFVEKVLMPKKHGGPLEHGTVYLKTDDDEIKNTLYVKYHANKYSKAHFATVKEKKTLFVTTNLRVLFENEWMDDLKYFSEPTRYHEKRIMVRFNLDRFTGEEFLRHRPNSFCRESSRYVNYLMEKFGCGSISFILPPWLDDGSDESLNVLTEERYNEICRIVGHRSSFIGKLSRLWKKITRQEDKPDFIDKEIWMWSLMTAENTYNSLVQVGWQPQQARTVLPCAIKSPLIVTAFASDWVHFFNLRSDIALTGKPHPQAEELATPLREEFIERGYIKRKDLAKKKEKTETKQ